MLYIYRNLHFGDCFSIRKGGRVIERLSDFLAYDISFRVSEAGRQRVLRDRQKNVHAFVLAKSYEQQSFIDATDLIPITYNPYSSGTFVCGGLPITTCNTVAFTGGRCYFVL